MAEKVETRNTVDMINVRFTHYCVLCSLYAYCMMLQVCYTLNPQCLSFYSIRISVLMFVQVVTISVTRLEWRLRTLNGITCKRHPQTQSCN